MFGKSKKRIITVDGKQIELEHPKKGMFGFLGKKQPAKPAQQAQQQQSTTSLSQPNQAQKPMPQSSQPAQQSQQPQQAQQQPSEIQQNISEIVNVQQEAPMNPKDIEAFNKEIAEKIKNIKQQPKQVVKAKKSATFKQKADKMLDSHKGLRQALLEQGIDNPYNFLIRMRTASTLLAIFVVAAIFVSFNYMHMQIAVILLLSVMMGILTYFMSFNMFLEYPRYKTNQAAKNVEKNILFAARDILISLRSGMPLFNAISSVSTGYGDTSREFSKIVEHVELGMSLGDAIDKVISESRSQSFKKLMIQATTTIKAGADITAALQSVIDQLSQERIIELRRYGQRLNALAMFYMLFGVILPSMGIAVATILTTFLPLFTVNMTILELVIIGVVMIQIVFLQLIRQRPVFSM